MIHYVITGFLGR